MYKKAIMPKTSLRVNSSVEGEMIEQKIERIVNNKEPITDGAPIIFTDRRDGVQPDYDIRTDRFEAAIDAMDHVSKTHLAKRKAALKNKEKDGKTEPIQGQASQNQENGQTT